jgi:hypothetical protein
MTPNQANHTHQESTYQLLVESEEKERGVMEDLVYLLLIIATSVTIWQFGREPVKLAERDAVRSEHLAL